MTHAIVFLHSGSWEFGVMKTYLHSWLGRLHRCLLLGSSHQPLHLSASHQDWSSRDGAQQHWKMQDATREDIIPYQIYFLIVLFLEHIDQIKCLKWNLHPLIIFFDFFLVISSVSTNHVGKGQNMKKTDLTNTKGIVVIIIIKPLVCLLHKVYGPQIVDCFKEICLIFTHQ